ncbi:pyridoxamine 5'-phosphate oxidase family protein [Parasphingorhabdus sp. JC815]|uniref:pyridoxamine 5'-phosphate oxidase family protein n=1 Tax=Parasphingorhabdus sp. JC815 TaxID=3232140 RepID=UPI00345A7963
MSDRSEIREEFWKAMSDSPNLMVNLHTSNEHSVPMRAHLDKDADSEFWFYTSRTNRLAPGGAAMAQFVSKGHDIFACISGVLFEEKDETIIDKYWSNAVAAWFDRGREDPDMLMLRFDLKEAEIWTADMSMKGAFKMMTGIKMKESDSGGHSRVKL